MVKFQELVKKSITLFTKDSSKMIFTMDMVGLSILTEISILVTGLMESGLDTVGLLINLEGFMKANGSTVNSWASDDIRRVFGKKNFEEDL